MRTDNLMNRGFFYVATVMMAVAALSGCKTRQVVQTVGGDDRSIVVIYDNDVHCGIDGYARMAGLRDAVSDTAFAALVSSGDYLQGGIAGALSKGQYVVDIMRTMGYDAVALGNHEFDYNVPRMKELLSFAQLPVTCVNLYDNTTGQAVYPQYVMKTYGNKKVAFVGATTTTALYTEAYAFYDAGGQEIYNLCEKDIYQKVQDGVDAARKAGADYVVVISHIGESKTVINCDSHGLVEATRGIDAVLDGHTHSVIECDYVKNLDGKMIPVTQTGTKFQNVGKLVINSLGQVSAHLMPLDDIKIENPRVKAATDSINTLMESIINRPVCHSDFEVTILDTEGKQQVRYAETNSGDLVTDAYRSISGADVAITNGGGIRDGMRAGDLTYGDVLGMLPYDNNLSVVEVTGAELLAVLDTCCSFSPEENGDFPQVSGMKFTLHQGKRPCVTDLQILDNSSNEYIPVDAERRYTLATIDYCITGGGLQNMLRNAKVLKENICIYNEALIRYVRDTLGGKIPERYAKPQGRILVVG